MGQSRGTGGHPGAIGFDDVPMDQPKSTECHGSGHCGNPIETLSGPQLPEEILAARLHSFIFPKGNRILHLVDSLVMNRRSDSAIAFIAMSLTYSNATRERDARCANAHAAVEPILTLRSSAIFLCAWSIGSVLFAKAAKSASGDCTSLEKSAIALAWSATMRFA